MSLILELRCGETLLINGAAINFQTKSRLALTTPARFLFGKQIMPLAEATTPGRCIYLALQNAYVGPEVGRSWALHDTRRLIAEYKTTMTSALAREILDRSLAAAVADDCYQALKLVRRIIRHEDALALAGSAEATEAA